MKIDLLTEARASDYFDKHAFRLASESLNADEISVRRGVLSRRITVVRKIFQYLRYLTFAAVSIGLFVLVDQTAPPPPRPDELRIDWLFLSVISLTVAMLSMAPLAGIQALIHHFCANTSDSELLQPMAGTLQCEYSLEDLKNGGERVAQWRDLAVNERGQLHGFDGYVMSALRDVHRSQKAREERQAEVDLACRKLHGLEPLVPAANPALEPAEAP